MPNDGPVSVFFLVRSLQTGGAERQLVQLACGLQDRGLTVHVAAFYKRGPLLTELERRGVPVIDLGKKRRWDVVGFLWRTRRAIASVRPTILYSFLGGANIVAAAATMFDPGPKLVWSIRASDMDLKRYDRLRRISYRIERSISWLPDLIIANSHAGRVYSIARGFAADRLQVVPNGIDTDRFHPDETLRVRQRRAWGLADRDIVVGVLARFDPMKGHGTFLRAAAAASQRLPSAKFICIGEGREVTRIQQLANELQITDRVKFVGRSDDPTSALNALDVYCSSSDYGEGFSNSIAEAMACGLRCVVTDVGDSASIVGDCGTIVPRNDPLALADALVFEATRIADNDPQLPRCRIVENFGVAAMVDRTARLLHSVTSA